MPTLDQVRQTVARALEKAGEGPVEVAGAMGIERNYIRDFLQGRKSSLRADVMLDLSERFGIPFKDLVVTRKKPKSRTA
jgi:transcriptional regulator with XRE-family HTH domain